MSRAWRWALILYLAVAVVVGLHAFYDARPGGAAQAPCTISQAASSC
jgi:hypothetical protein